MDEHLKHVSADVQLVYSRISDDISRQIFENRLMMTLTQSEKNNSTIEFLRGRRDKDKRIKELFDVINELDGDILIYGAGECGRYIYDSKFMEGVPVQGFIDNKEWYKGTINNLPIYRFENAVKDYRKANIILSMESCASRMQIKEQIAKKRNDWKIIDAGEILRKIDKELLLEIENPYYKYVYDLVNTSKLGSELLSKIMKNAHPVACWITFEDGDDIGRLLKEKWGHYPWCCYLTKDKKQSEYNGIPVYTYEEAVGKYDQLDIVIESESVPEGEAVREKLSSSGILGECISLVDIAEALDRRQYFDFFEYAGVKETFVDGGVFDLGSTKQFIAWCNGDYERIFAFEPEKGNYELCKEKIEKYDNIRLINCGLFDRQGKIGFTSGLGGASRIENQEQDFYSDYNIEVTDLDSVVKGAKVTFIKMDIEGAEGKALLGAKRIITEQKPKLAICVYHKPEDIIELPTLVLGMRPDYKIAFRHYSLRDTETVMYAW